MFRLSEYNGSKSNLSELTSVYWRAIAIVPTAAIATPDALSNGECVV